MSQRTPARSGIQGLVLSCIAMSCNRWFPENGTCISWFIATLWGKHHCHTLGVHLYILVVFATPERTTNPLTTPVLVKESTALCKMGKNCCDFLCQSYWGGTGKLGYYWWWCGATRMLVLCWWFCRSVQPLWRSLWRYHPAVWFCVYLPEVRLLCPRDILTPLFLCWKCYTQYGRNADNFTQSVVRATVPTGQKQGAPFVSRNVQTVGFLGFGQCFPDCLPRKGEG